MSLTNTEGQSVCDGGDGDGNRGEFERLSQPLLDAELEARVTPARNQDEQVINADTWAMYRLQTSTDHYEILMSQVMWYVCFNGNRIGAVPC